MKNIDGKLMGKNGNLSSDDQRKVHMDSTVEEPTAPVSSDNSVLAKVVREGPIPTSYVFMFKDTSPKKTVKISEMRSSNCVPCANVTIPLEVLDEVSNLLANTLYGYFIGK